MAAATAPVNLAVTTQVGIAQLAWPVKTATTIYAGTGVCLEAANGYARPVAASLTTPEFLGFALEDVEASAAASGTKSVLLMRECELEVAAIAGAATNLTEIGASVYMSDDQTFTLTSTNNVLVGKITFYDAARAKWRIFIQAESLRSL